ncbi:MAG: type II toxin-antitoxin system RelE/ParE family toxin [Gammaproteobacteria bacterium]|nr:type II toxin-antitoxin system RelE/ParE family toxin [Gammaproteobacteria bacterium]
MPGERSLYWVGSSLEDLRAFPDAVIDVMGYALHLAQEGGKHPDAKSMKGFPGGSVHEITADYGGDTWRAVYMLKFKDVIYVLHAFQKKSKQGIKTPQQHIRMVHRRLKLAKEHHEQESQKKQR